MGVRERLVSLGTDLGEFNQSAYRGKEVTIDGTDLKGGYCAGVCLDWARRVLQSASNRNEKYLSYSTEKGATTQRRTQTLRRMAAGYKGQGASYVTTTRKTDCLSKLTALLKEPDSEWTIDGKDVTGIAVPNETAELIAHFFDFTENNPFNMEKEPAGVVQRERVEKWKNSVAARPDAQHTRLADGGREWGQYSQELDDKFSKSKKKKFSNLSVVASSNQQTYGSPSTWLGELMSEAFRENCCTIVGVGAPGATGHAVAVHVVNGEYRFFDPNYGVFKYTKEALQSALQHLFWTPYFQGEEGQDTDLPVYRRRDSTNPRDEKEWTRMSYTIFKAN